MLENQETRQDRILFIFMFIFIIFMFAFKDLLILFFSDYKNLYALKNVDINTFEETFLYLPMLRDFSLAKITFMFVKFPPITFFVYFVLYKLTSSFNFVLFISHVVFPSLSFYFIYLIFKKYIYKSWAALLSFFGVTFFHNYSSLTAFLNMIIHPTQASNFASSLPLEISRFPFPSFSFLFFVICFYLSIKSYKITNKRWILLTLLWTANIYVYIYNFIAGMLFWYFYLIFIEYINSKKILKKEFFYKIGQTILLSLVVLIPYFVFTKTSNILDLGTNNLANFFVNDWGVFFSYIFPIVILALVIYAYCGDYYELFYKFTPVFILIVVEMISLNLHFILGRSFQPELFSLRLGNFFFRYLYFVPVIYFLSNPIKTLNRFKAKHNTSKILHKFFNEGINKHRKIIVVFGILSVSLVVFVSSFKFYKNYKLNVAPSMIKLEQQAKDLVLEKNSGSKNVKIHEDLMVNLSVTFFYPEHAFIVSEFNSFLPRKEVIRRLCMYVASTNLNQEGILDFMNRDLAYWLVWNRKKLDEKERSDYKRIIIDEYIEYLKLGEK